MKKETQKKLVTALIVIAVVVLMLTAHILVNNFNIVEVIKTVHGG